MRDEDDPIERRRNQRQSGKQTRLIIAVAVVAGIFVATTASVIAINVMRRMPAATAVLGPDLTMTAQEMIDKTAGNPTAIAPHNGKIVRLTGKMHRVSGNVHGETFLYFENHNENGRGESPRCFFDNPSDLANLRKGDTITLQGQIRANGSGVDIGPCRIVR